MRKKMRLAPLLLSASFVLLLSGCGIVPYDEESVQGAIFAEDLKQIAEIGPATFEADSTDDDNFPKPKEFHPTLPLGESGYAVHYESHDVYIYFVDGSSGEEVGNSQIDGEQLAEPYVARVINAGVDNSLGDEPLVVLTNNFDGLGWAQVYDRNGFLTEVDLFSILSGSPGNPFPSGLAIVGAYFRSIDGTTDELALLARQLDAASFKEAYLTVTANGTITFSSWAGGGTFNLPNLTDDITIYNGAFVRDPVSGFNYFTVQDDYEFITYRWNQNNPGTTLTEISVGNGIVSHATLNGTLMVEQGEKLLEFDTDGNVVNSFRPGTVTPIGLYWTGGAVQELYSAVGVSRGIPSATILAQLFRR